MSRARAGWWKWFSRHLRIPAEAVKVPASKVGRWEQGGPVVAWQGSYDKEWGNTGRRVEAQELPWAEHGVQQCNPDKEVRMRNELICIFVGKEAEIVPLL